MKVANGVDDSGRHFANDEGRHTITALAGATRYSYSRFVTAEGRGEGQTRAQVEDVSDPAVSNRPGGEAAAEDERTGRSHERKEEERRKKVATERNRQTDRQTDRQ